MGPGRPGLLREESPTFRQLDRLDQVAVPAGPAG
jgi:hypothetical protein